MVLGKKLSSFSFFVVLITNFAEMGTFFSDRFVKKGSVMLAFVV